MSESTFEWVCDELEARSRLSRIEARGTVRLVLKRAGFTPKGISASSLRVVVSKLLVRKLEKMNIEDAVEICEAIASSMPMDPGFGDDFDSATTIFARLGRLRRPR